MSTAQARRWANAAADIRARAATILTRADGSSGTPTRDRATDPAQPRSTLDTGARNDLLAGLILGTVPTEPQVRALQACNRPTCWRPTDHHSGICVRCRDNGDTP